MSRYDWFRRRIAPLAFALAIVLMARESCNKEHRTNATIVLELGSAAPSARSLDAEIWMGGERVSVFHREAIAGRGIDAARFKASLPGDDGELRVDVDLDGSPHHVVRRFHADDGSTVNVRLGPDLATP